MTIERLQSGVPGLDTILHGGFLRGGLYIVQGQPGAGKTILANQICFTRARDGHNALFVTVLAETHARMMAHVSCLEFFDESLIPSRVSYVSAFATLATDGVKALLDLLRREMRAHKATILVIDGFAAVEQAAGSDLEYKRFVHELQVHAGMLGCTTFLLTSSVGRRGYNPEHTMVDGLIELGDEELLRRTERHLQISKFRGSPILRGRHSYEISDAGVRVYLRTEAVLRDVLPNDGDIQRRVTTGVADLDAMIGGGYPHSTSTLIVGSSGAGKTSLGLAYLAQSTAEEPGLLFSFYESPKRAIDKGRGIGLPIEEKLRSGALEVIYESPTERLLDVLAAQLLDNVRRRGVKRLVIDGLPGFQSSTLNPERLPRFFAALFNELRARACTLLCTIETRSIFETEVQLPVPGVSALAENVVLLRSAEHLGRLQKTILVTKVRDSGFDERRRELRISSEGLRIVDVPVAT